MAILKIPFTQFLLAAILFIFSGAFIYFALSAQGAYDTALAERLTGCILLQVEEHGEAWYVRTSDNKRYYMKDGASAYTMMRYFSLGITNADLAKISSVADTTEMNASTSVCSSNSLAERVKGEILLQVEEHGEAWYLDPEKCRRIYMENGSVAYEIMRFLGLGILNVDLEKIEDGGSVLEETDSDASEDTTEEEVFDPAAYGSPHPKVVSDDIPSCCSHPYYHSIYRASSEDALEWQVEGVKIKDHASVPAIIQLDDDSYILYYVDGSYDTLDCQVSETGETFTDGNCTIYGFTEERAWDPYVVKLSDGYWRLYFVSPPDGPGSTKIMSALSTDGISWLQEDGVRFQIDDLAIIDPAVKKMGDIWRMYTWYEGDGDGSSIMVTATSSDGLTFTEEKQFDAGGGIPEVTQLDSGLWGLYVCANGISLSTSADGVNDWSSLSTMIAPGAGQIVCDPSIIKTNAGDWMMYYKIQEVH